MSEQKNASSTFRRRLAALTPQSKLLFFACKHGFDRLAKKAINMGANINAFQKIARDYDGISHEYDEDITVIGTPLMLAINREGAAKSPQKQAKYREIIGLLLGSKTLDKELVAYTKNTYYENDGTSSRVQQPYSLGDIIKSNFYNKFGNSYIEFWKRTSEDVLSLLSKKTNVLQYDTKAQTYTLFGALGHKESEGILVWNEFANRFCMRPTNDYYENGSLKEKYSYVNGYQTESYDPTGKIYERIFYRQRKGISDDENATITDKLNYSTGHYARIITYTGPRRKDVCSRLSTIKENAPVCDERQKLMRKIVADYRAQNIRVD